MPQGEGLTLWYSTSSCTCDVNIQVSTGSRPWCCASDPAPCLRKQQITARGLRPQLGCSAGGSAVIPVLADLVLMFVLIWGVNQQMGRPFVFLLLCSSTFQNKS